MSDDREKLQHEVKDAQRARAEAEAEAEAEARYDGLEAEHHSAINEAENTRKQLERAHQEWLSALDAVEDPIFVHDKDFRVLRCNRAYQQCAGIPFKQIIGQPYYEVFPKIHTPLPNCQRGKGSAMDEGDDELLLNGRIYRSRATTIKNEQGGFLYSMHTLEDITERKRAEAALRGSRDLLQSVVETAPVRIFWKDTELRFLGCNTRFALDAGLTRPEELIGKSDFNMPWKAQAEFYRADDKAVMESDLPKLGIEEPQTTPRGDTIWLRTSKVPLRDEDNRVIGLLGVYEDITERLQAETKLRESELAYRSLTQNLPGMVYRVFVREHNRMEFYNETVIQLTGYKKDELASSTVCSIEPLILDEDRPIVVTEVTNAIAAHRPFVVEYRLLHKNGSQQWMREHGMPVFDLDNEPLYIDGVIFDITENKQAEIALLQSEEKFRALVESTNDWIWEIDRQGRYTYASPQIEALLGYSLQEVLGKSPFDFMTPRETEQVGKTLTKLIEKHVPIIALENANLHKDGHEVILETSGLPFFDENGELSGYRGIDRDITERKRVEANLAEQLEELHRWYAATQGREERILELKHEVNALLGQAGQPPRYPSAESPEPKPKEQ